MYYFNQELKMKVVKTDKHNWVAVPADGRVLLDGYPKSTPSSARRAGEQALVIESVRKNSGDESAIRWILENI